MANWWPWLAIAGVGAVHGLNPASGWMWAAAWGLRSRDRAHALRSLVPIAVGHAASLALVAAAVMLGVALDRTLLQAMAGALLVAAAALHLHARTAARVRAPAGHAGLALWSFMMSTAHGAGLMLVPALVPLCMDDAPLRAAASSSVSSGLSSGTLMLALAAVGLHTVAMLVVTGVVAIGVCRGFDTGRGWLRKPVPEARL